MNLKRAGRWGIAGVLGVAGTAGALAALFLNPKTGERNRKAVGAQTKAVARRERAHIAAMAGAAKSRTAAATRRRASTTKLEEAVMAALEAAGAHGIDVHARAGVVRLRGEVARLSDIRAYGKIAASVEGVREVENVLRLSA